MEANLQPAWVMHRRPYGDGGLLVELLTVDAGRLGAVARGIHRKSRGGAQGGMLQPFTPLLVSIAGRGELKSLRRVETVAARVPLAQVAVFSGLYLNELVTRLLPRFDPNPRVFAAYGATLDQLTDRQLTESALRHFELLLLAELGYQVVFMQDIDGDSVESNTLYYFDPVRGFVRQIVDRDASRKSSVPSSALLWFSGETLCRLARWQGSDEVLAEDLCLPLKQITRSALAAHLGDRPLRSRELVRSFMGKSREAVNVTAAQTDRS